MKINKDHFIGMENYNTSCDAEIRNLLVDRFSYGLLPLLPGQRSNIEFEAAVNEQGSLIIRVSTCHAITMQGHRIDISEDAVQGTFQIADAPEKEFYLGISVDPYSRVPSGMAQPAESPVRQPFVIPGYTLHIIPAATNLSSGLSPAILPVGKLAVVNNRPQTDTSYIPPCISIGSHEELMRFHAWVLQNVISLERNTVELLAEINLKTTPNALINIIQYIAQNVMYFMSGKISEFKWLTLSKPPVLLISDIIELARSVKNSFDTRTPEEREKFLNYLSDYFDINPAKLKQLLETTIGMDYQHAQILQSVKKAEDFMNVFTQIINELRKMEFIAGEKRKKHIDIIIR